MKFVKFGYGRASDHASKDIRTGYMTRDEGINMVKKHLKPTKQNKGGIVSKEAFLDISNVKTIDKKIEKKTEKKKVAKK